MVKCFSEFGLFVFLLTKLDLETRIIKIYREDTNINKYIDILRKQYLEINNTLILFLWKSWVIIKAVLKINIWLS